MYESEELKTRGCIQIDSDKSGLENLQSDINEQCMSIYSKRYFKLECYLL